MMAIVEITEEQIRTIALAQAETEIENQVKDKVDAFFEENQDWIKPIIKRVIVRLQEDTAFIERIKNVVAEDLVDADRINEIVFEDDEVRDKIYSFVAGVVKERLQ